MRNLHVYRNSQSVIISGESRAGKTETSKLLLNVFCQEQGECMNNANILLEAFGNSRTTENFNSSRFIKVIQVQILSLYICSILINLNNEFKQVGYDLNNAMNRVNIYSYMLESNRVCVGSNANFHIIYYLLQSPERLKTKLYLDNESFSVSFIFQNGSIARAAR